MGMWSAMSKTKELTNVATQSGITVVELMALQKAFIKAGASGDEIPGTMAKLASALGEISDPGTEAAKTFAMIGLRARRSTKPIKWFLVASRDLHRRLTNLLPSVRYSGEGLQ
jgi:hypothetical protein